MMYPVTKPTLPDFERYTRYVRDANERHWLTNFGPLHQELTERLKAYLGVEHLLLVANGTLALQVAYRVLGLTGRVLTTPFSFVATTASLAWEGLDPVFADIDPAGLNLDPAAAKTVEDVSGIVAVHVYGNPCDVEGLAALGRERHIPVLYDAAHAFGSTYDGEGLLRWGNAATLSFHATKLFHTIEGGAIVFADPAHLDAARELINFGIRDGEPYRPAGLNAKLNEYQAAAGLALFDMIDEVLEKRAALVHAYRSLLDGWADFQSWHPRGEITGAYMPILLRDEREALGLQRDLEQRGIGTRRYFHPSLNCLGGLSNQSCPVSENIASRVLCLPIYTDLTPGDVRVVCEHVKAAIKVAA